MQGGVRISRVTGARDYFPSPPPPVWLPVRLPVIERGRTDGQGAVWTNSACHTGAGLFQHVIQCSHVFSETRPKPSRVISSQTL